MSELRALPSVDALLQSDAARQMVAQGGRELALQALRSTLENIRASHHPGEAAPDAAHILDQARRSLDAWLKPTLLPVINASGVVLHTNLGRAPLSRAAMLALQGLGGCYNTLEFDLERGERGSRSLHVERLLRLACGAEAGLVVNNNAAAVLLALSALAARRRVVISRTQLVEIGGGFRVPDVMKQSGARLVEVGATNRVHLADYEEALDEGAAAVLRAHPSNFRMLGFTSEPPLVDLAQAAHRRGALLLDDLGSGALLDTAAFGMVHEPTVQESLAAGADLVCFSGDKLLGGPQAGILVGRSGLVDRCRRHPLARAVRADKLCLAALSATLLHYVKGEALTEVPVWRMISCSPQDLRARAEAWQQALGRGEVTASLSTVGGGSLPGETLPTFALSLDVRQPNRFLARLRALQLPLIGRVENERVLLDPRTVLPEQDGALVECLKSISW